MRKKVLIVLGVVVLLAAIGTPTYLLYADNIKDKEKAFYADAESKFIQQYGVDNKIIKSELLDKVLVAYWQDSEYLHVSIELGAAWVEVFRQPLVSEESTESEK